MICINPATHTVAGGTLAMTGTEYNAEVCNIESYVLMTSHEFQLMAPPGYNLTAEQGTQIAMAIALLWAVGATFRVLIHFLKSNGVSENE